MAYGALTKAKHGGISNACMTPCLCLNLMNLKSSESVKVREEPHGVEQQVVTGELMRSVLESIRRSREALRSHLSTCA